MRSDRLSLMSKSSIFPRSRKISSGLQNDRSSVHGPQGLLSSANTARLRSLQDQEVEGTCYAPCQNYWLINRKCDGCKPCKCCNIYRAICTFKAPRSVKENAADKGHNYCAVAMSARADLKQAPIPSPPAGSAGRRDTRAPFEIT